MVDLLARERGRLTDAGYREIVDYARERGFTAGEVRALVQPADYLEDSAVLRAAGVGLADVRCEAGAWEAATKLAAEFGLRRPLARLPNARPDGAPPGPVAPPAPATAPAPSVPDRAAAATDLAAALAAGRELGDPAGWRATTPGATVTFVSRVGSQTLPAVVLDTPEWSDPAPRDLLVARAGAVAQVRDRVQVRALVRAVAKDEPAYLEAADVTDGANRRYGVQDVRRHALFEALARALAAAPLPPGERAALPGVLAAAKEELLCGRDVPMQTGSHTNYWPYWRNYRGVVAKMLAQTAPRTDDWYAIKNRLEDIHDHKTVLTTTRSVDERDVETTTGAALVYRLPYGDDDGHRVSLAAGSFPTQPLYEVLSVVDGGLPEPLARFAGLPVVRDTDVAGTLRFDGDHEAAGVRSGDPVPAELAARVRARKVDAASLGLRPLGRGERARSGVPGDWRRDGGIQIPPIDISWWGHCHNESPLNAMGIDPRQGVELYRADRGVAAAAARQSYTSDDLWDLFGALAADHEGGYGVPSSLGELRPTQVEKTKFVGSRNDGGHWLLLLLDAAGARRIRIEAAVTELWHRTDPTQRYERPSERFRRDLPADDGTFSPNPDWVAADADDDDEITVDVLGRRLTVVTTYVTFADDGRRREVKATVELDPARPGLRKLAEEVVHAEPAGGGRLVEHWYDPSAHTYVRTTVEVAAGTPARRTETERDAPLPVKAAQARQETVYDSVIDIHDFVTKNMGLPFVFDTSSGLAVWNYPVATLRLDLDREVDAREDARPFSYTSYRLRYETMGGPSGDARYIIKRDAGGNAVRAVAIDPMPDFAFRNEHWVCAPAAADASGRAAYSKSALGAGYLTDKRGEKLVTAWWGRAAVLAYAALDAGAAPVWLFEATDGRLVRFAKAADFEAAVAADRALRDAGG